MTARTVCRGSLFAAVKTTVQPTNKSSRNRNGPIEMDISMSKFWYNGIEV